MPRSTSIPKIASDPIVRAADRRFWLHRLITTKPGTEANERAIQVLVERHGFKR